MDEILRIAVAAVAPHLAEAGAALVLAAATWATTWMRAQAQRMAAEHATSEVEVAGIFQAATTGEKMPSEEKKQLAMERAEAKLPKLLRPRRKRLDTLIEAAVPKARASTPTPPPPRKG